MSVKILIAAMACIAFLLSVGNTINACYQAQFVHLPRDLTPKICMTMGIVG